MLATVPFVLASGAAPTTSLLAVAVGADTLVARTIAQRDPLDWATGLLALVALLLLVALLAGLITLVLALRRGVAEVASAVHRLTDEARPLLVDAQGMMTDLHGMVRQVRTDVERLSGAAGTVGDHVRDAADAAAGRLEELGETLDQLQDELESTVESASGALRGLRLALLGLLMGEPAGRGARPRRRRAGRTRPVVPPEGGVPPDTDPHA